MNDETKLFTNYSINLNIDDSSSSQGFFSFFSSKNVALSICPYKTNLIILMSDFSIINYDIVNKTKIFDIKDAQKYNPLILKILYYQIPLFDKDYLLVLCENNILLLNITSFIIEYNLSIKDKAISIELLVLNNTYYLVVMYKYKIEIYKIEKERNKNSKIPLRIDSWQVVQSINNDKIIEGTLFVYQNLIEYQTETKIVFFTFKTIKNINTQTLIFDKKINFQRQIPNYDELNALNKYLDELYKKYNMDKFKSLDLYKNFLIEYSSMNNCLLIATYNRLFVMNSFYDTLNENIIETELNNSKEQKKFKMLDKLTKPNIIFLLKVLEPYLCLIYDEQIYIFLILDYNKCVYHIKIDPSFDFCFYKPIRLLKNLHLLDYTNDVINYNDELLLNEIAKKKKSDLSLTARPVIYTFYNKDNSLKYFSLGKLLLHLSTIKKIKTIFASKLLSILDYNKTNNNVNMKYYNKEVEKRNRKFVGYRIIDLFCNEIKNNNYENALNIYIDNNMNIIFILILIKNIIISKDLNNLLVLSLFEYVFKVSFDYEKLNLNLFDNETENSLENDISIFIKYFFNTLMLKRNEIKNNFSPKEIKYISFQNLIEELNIKSIDHKLNFDIKNYNDNIEIIKLLEKKKEDMISFILLENILFIVNYYSYKSNKDNKFLSNLYGLIKMSVNILDTYMIELLKESNLNSLVLLFYYSKGDYEQCFSCIKSFYDSAPADDKGENVQYDVFFDDKLSSNKSKGSDKSKRIDTDEEKNKSYWFKTYIYLISKIFSKISENEFCSRIKWAMTNNSYETIDLLIYYKIIDDQKINYSFIELMKPYGLDPIIYYFGKFSSLYGGKTESNEIINLYSIKIKLLDQENKTKEKEGKFKKEIEETSNQLCRFLINNKNYDVDKAYDRILNDISFCEKEIGILLIKKKYYEAGVNKIMNINNNENYVIELLFMLVEELPCFELVNIIIQKLKEIQFINHTTEQIILQILKKIENETDILIKIMSSNILDDYSNEDLTNFFIDNIFLLEQKTLRNKIEASLIGSQILDNKNILYDKQSESVLINSQTVCNKCKKSIYYQPATDEENEEEKQTDNMKYKDYGVKRFDGKIYHFQCFNNL